MILQKMETMVLDFILECIGYALLLIFAAIVTAYFVSLKTYLKKDSFKIRGVKGLKTYF